MDLFTDEFLLNACNVHIKTECKEILKHNQGLLKGTLLKQTVTPHSGYHTTHILTQFFNHSHIFSDLDMKSINLPVPHSATKAPCH